MATIQYSEESIGQYVQKTSHKVAVVGVAIMATIQYSEESIGQYVQNTSQGRCCLRFLI